VETITGWRRSSFCASGECLEAAACDDGVVAVRVTADREGPVLKFSGEEWTRFVGRVKSDAGV
jgi:Domain of unknown function (DUF397)